MPEREGVPGKAESQSPVAVVTSRHLCHILFARNESLSPAHTQGEGVTQGHEFQES